MEFICVNRLFTGVNIVFKCVNRLFTCVVGVLLRDTNNAVAVHVILVEHHLKKARKKRDTPQYELRCYGVTVSGLNCAVKIFMSQCTVYSVQCTFESLCESLH